MQQTKQLDRDPIADLFTDLFGRTIRLARNRFKIARHILLSRQDARVIPVYQDKYFAYAWDDARVSGIVAPLRPDLDRQPSDHASSAAS